ncbi:hypothetical protein CPB86DRAFT_350960 [Serendipita vermifera]|nr:hypothetical protein CPB86DRAFT_350960 [Serendipita vermifera]
MATNQYPDASAEAIKVKVCRKCSGRFEYELDKDTTVTILCGPPQGVIYHAMSYVWGDVRLHSLHCQHCQSVTKFPIKSVDKFQELVSLCGPGSSIWLDCLSIDQSDPDDIKAQVATMGNIYKGTSSVGVLLPPEDKEAYEILARIHSVAVLIIQHRNDILANNERDFGNGITLGAACRGFYSELSKLENKLDTFTYWQRAWTFQEWALASSTDIACEGVSEPRKLEAVKPLVFAAGHLLAEYKLKYHQYAEISLGFSRGEVPTRFDTIKRLFPLEDYLLPYDDVKESDSAFQTLFPHLGTDAMLGIRSEPPKDEAAKFRARLNIMLDALSATKRQARFEADLVCCWASMCNIAYDYRREDSLGEALQKVITALRERGTKIYNFQANTSGSSGVVDLSFLNYSHAHQQCNATNNSYLPGAPVFTGVADTAVHIQTSLSQPLEPTAIEGDCVELTKVGGDIIFDISHLAKYDKVALRKAMSPTFVGISDGFRFTDVYEKIARVIESTDRAVLGSYSIVVVSIPAKNKGTNAYLSAWGACRTSDISDDLFVAREDINGTLVLANAGRVVSYLVLTSQQDGSHLIQTDEEGNINMKLKTPARGDVIMVLPGQYGSDVADPSYIQVSIQLEAKSKDATGSAPADSGPAIPQASKQKKRQMLKNLGPRLSHFLNRDSNKDTHS